MENFKLILVLLALLITFSASADPPDKEKYSFTDIWDVQIDCANDGQGEWIHGEIQVYVLRITKKDGSTHGRMIPKKAYVTGTQSGEIYHLIRSSHHHTRANDGTNFSHSFHHYIGKKGTQIKVITRISYGFNTNGDYVLYHMDHSVECK